MKTSETFVLLTNLILALVILGFGWYLALHLQKPDLFQRSGALLSALGTLGIVGQVYIEMLLEQRAKEVEQTIATELSRPSQIAGLRALKERLLRNVRDAEAGQYRIHRLRLIGFFACLLALGTLVNGVGDYFVPVSRKVVTHPASPTHHRS